MQLFSLKNWQVPQPFDLVRLSHRGFIKLERLLPILQCRPQTASTDSEQGCIANTVIVGMYYFSPLTVVSISNPS